ncbi:MAG TPA: FAD-dependent monooxygenase [Candidatus Angelobacter sp.]|nr:FAD-dependent monooxygenase [Candidatus Angelobacter sp.]
MPSTALQRPVAIVGGGPVGLVLALFLDRLGVETVVFNAVETTRWHPRGSTHNSRTMEHYRTLGFSKQIRQLGLPLQHPRDVFYLTRLNGYELARVPLGTELQRQQAAENAEATAQIVEPLIRANQMYVDRFLLEQARLHPRITLRFGWQVSSVEQEADRVTLRAESIEGRTETWTASYAIGCDGGHSMVRRTLGISYSGKSAENPAFMAGSMISAHVRIQRAYKTVLRGREGWLYNVLNPKQRLLLFSLDGKDDFLMMTNTATGALMDNTQLREYIVSATGADLPVTIVGQQTWTGGIALVADSFGGGRIFLAGDSAHLFSPTGGLGMNTGLEDAANLAWKLAASIQGWGGENLLATYETERRPVAFRNTIVARGLTHRLGDVKVPDELEDSTAQGAAARSQLGELLHNFSGQFSAPGMELGARYDGSPVIMSSPGDAPPHDHPVIYTPTSMPGGRLPHLWLDAPGPGRRSVFDQLDSGFNLIRVGEDAPAAEAFEDASRRLRIPVKVVDLPRSPAHDLYQTRLILVRPDRYIAWRGDALPDDVPGLLSAAVGGGQKAKATRTGT